MPTLPADKALVRFRYTKTQPALPPVPPPAGSPPGTLPIPRPERGAGTEDIEVFELDPPARDVAEVERQWREANKGSDKDWQDAAFIDEPPTPPAPVPPKEEPDVDAQGVRHRAAGQEDLPPTVTKTEDAHPAPTGKGEAETFGHGDKQYPLSYFDGKTDEEILQTDGVGDATLKDIRRAQRKRDAAAAKQQVTVK